MILLVFSYALSIFLFVYSYYADSKMGKLQTSYTSLTMTAAFASLFVTVAANLLYVGSAGGSGLLFKLAMVTLALFSCSLFRYCASIPYFTRKRFLEVVIWIVFAFSVWLVFTAVSTITWSESAGFSILSKTTVGGIDGLALYAGIYVVGLPGLAVISLFLRALATKSRIYRQRMLFVTVAILAGGAVSYFFYVLSETYYWALTFVPFGFALMLFFMQRSLSLTTLYDRAHAVATIVNFLVLSLVFGAFAAFVSATVAEFVALPVILGVAFTAMAVALYSLRDLVAARLHRYVRVGSDYEKDLEAGLDSLDFSVGGDEIVTKTVSLLEQYVECSSVDILVANDKGKLVTAYSTWNAKNELPSDSKTIDFLLNRNESVILKTQAVSNHVYGDIKADLLKVFELGRADAMIMLREGRRVVGLILLGAKKRGADYTDYDDAVLSKLYSNFFLVMYYLKNIANESVVMTVDRELEFSGQIITSIQENIDRIEHEKVDVDFITRSARKLGGDFIDFIKLAEDKYLFVMGDVSGKGLNASMSMVILKSVLRTFLSETSDFKQLVVKVNLFIKNNLPKGTFFAGVFGMMDFSTNTMYYINCGVPAMFLYTAAYNNAIEIQGDGKVLGFVRDVSRYLKVKKIVLNPQDIILLTTDGLVDSTNLRGERFGKDRVQRMLMDNRTYPAGRMAQFLCDSLGDFVSRELEDDITVLVFKYLSK